jgi:aromatic-L-amino-acid/L-tryptophan decarboxylase
MQDHQDRTNPLEIRKDDFKKMGHALIDMLADFYETIERRPVTPAETPGEIKDILGDGPLPVNGSPAETIVARSAELLLNHSLLNGHPKFLGFVTSSPTQIGALADLLVAAVNPNVGANILSPLATAIEKQTVHWLAEFIGVPSSYGGLLVSGGNFANFTGFLAARTSRASKDLKKDGLRAVSSAMVFYCSTATHTWIEKVAILFGHGTNSIRWIPTTKDNTMNTEILDQTIQKDLDQGYKPFLVVGNSGDVSTGAVDDLSAISAVCKKYDLWFHIDGAYGIPAALLPEYQAQFEGITEADSIALDPHKWLYAPLEAGCILVKNAQHLLDTYSAHPDYYNFDSSDGESTLNYYEYGFQNSRCFRALKVWMALQQAGKSGYIQLIRDDIALSRILFAAAENHPELRAMTNHLSITTFQYVPAENAVDEVYLNKLNERLLTELQKGGEIFLSDAIIDGRYCLRACVVNYRTSEKDIYEIIEIIVRDGRRIHRELRGTI